MTNQGFSGNPKTTWLDEAGPDRGMLINEDFWFRDGRDETWLAPAGAVIDGASIPRALWTIVGSPYTGDYRRASLVHDVACEVAGDDSDARRRADRMFFEACRAGGCSARDAMVLYVGVRMGAWYRQILLEEQSRPRLHRDSVDRQVEDDFQFVGEQVLTDGETDDAVILERRVDAALTRLTARKAGLQNLMQGGML